MLNLKQTLFTLSVIFFSAIILSTDSLHGAQSEEEVQQEEQREREALRDRFRVFHREYLEKQTIRQLNQQERTSNSPQQSTNTCTEFSSEVMRELEQNYTPEQLQEQVNTSMDEAINTLAHLKQQFFRHMPLRKLLPADLLCSIHKTLDQKMTINTMRRLFGLPPQDLPLYAKEVPTTRLDRELLLFNQVAGMLKRCGIQNLDTLLEGFSQFHPSQIQALFSSLDQNESLDTLREYQISSYILDMLDIDARVDDQNRTLLIHFALQGDTKKAELLCQNGANPSKKDSTGRCAIDYARQYNHTETERLLLGFRQKNQEITELTKCIDTCLPEIQAPRDVVALIRDLAHADDTLHKLNKQFADKESTKRYYSDKAFKDFVQQIAQQMLNQFYAQFAL